MCVSMPLRIPDIYKKQRHRYWQARVLLRPNKRARACGQCQSNELHLFVTSYMGKLVITADRKMRDLMKRKCTCKRCRYRSAACRHDTVHWSG